MICYDGWCRRIDLNFRARYPYFSTKIYKIDECKYHLHLLDEVDNFDEISHVFNEEIRYVTAPIKLVYCKPVAYIEELSSIGDQEIPYGFSGFPFTIDEIQRHIESVHSDIVICSVVENYGERKLVVELEGDVAEGKLSQVENTAKSLSCVFPFEIIAGGTFKEITGVQDHVFNIAPSSHFKELECDFLERDEKLWFESIEEIYKGSYTKEDLYFYDSKKTSCLVNFSRFSNVNIRNLLLLYDVVYCVLPLSEKMSEFLNSQRITRDEIIELAGKGRVRILNMQPEIRLDYGFINEIYEENSSGVVSRRALSALCAIDIVEINNSYIFSDPEINKYGLELSKEIASINGVDANLVRNFLYWPKIALRNSVETLNFAGPMAIARYGVNIPIVDSLPLYEKREAVEFEFVVNSDQIHIAHALDSTYFPFHVKNDKYTDHPYALMMGNMLNFYRNFSDVSMLKALALDEDMRVNNPSLELISIFEINKYMSVKDFENDVSSSVVRKGMNSLFSELAQMSGKERKQRVEEYNAVLEKTLKIQDVSRHALDLVEDGAGLVVPFLGTGKKVFGGAKKLAVNNFPTIQAVSEYIEDKITRKNGFDRHVSLLSRVNRVAKLKRDFG